MTTFQWHTRIASVICNHQAHRHGHNSLQEAKLLSAKERNSLYYIDYSLKKADEEEPRIFQTAVALGAHCCPQLCPPLPPVPLARTSACHIQRRCVRAVADIVSES